MSYQPPHLRKQAQEGEAPPSPGMRRDGSRGDFGGGFKRDSSFGNMRRTDSREQFPRSDSYGSFSAGGMRRNDSHTNMRRSDSKGSFFNTEVPPARWLDWKPSERVQALTPEQVQETRERLNLSVEEEPSSSPAAVAPIESFDDMMVDAALLQDIRSRGFDRPTPIQAQTVPIGLSGRDILGCAETGSGKTAAFSIPMIQHCLNQEGVRRGDGPLALVMAPTRELAQQARPAIEKEIRSLSNFLGGRLRTTIVVGGSQMSDQRIDLRNGVEIVVATPGRLVDHLQQGNTNMARVSFVVLDEADRMLDMGFEPQIREVLGGLPVRHQTLLFSATMPEEVEVLAQKYLKNPVRVKVGQVSTPTANVAQHLEKTTDTTKIDALLTLLLEEQHQAEQHGQDFPLTIIFVERKNRADDVAAAIATVEGLSAAALHGGRSQQEREMALEDFRAGRCLILVATDVASRGLDINGIAHVINLDLPRNFEDYVHRIGRTGRGGAVGRATSFYCEKDQAIVSQIKKALSDLESGNTQAFLNAPRSKEDKKREKELSKAVSQGLKLGAKGVVTTGGAEVKVDDKYKFMATTLAMGSDNKGVADDAWDD